MLGSSQHLGASYREVNQFDSLHIVLSSRQNPGGSCSVHLDSVSPVVGRDDKTGHIIYDPGKVLQHLTTDLLHTPLIIVPGSEQGIVFGIRF